MKTRNRLMWSIFGSCDVYWMIHDPHGWKTVVNFVMFASVLFFLTDPETK